MIRLLVQILVCLHVVTGCVGSIDAFKNQEGLYVHDADGLKIELDLQRDHHFKLWIRNGAGSCYSEGTYTLARTKVNLTSTPSSNDETYKVLYEVGECQIHNSLIEIEGNDSIKFDNYYLKKLPREATE